MSPDDALRAFREAVTAHHRLADSDAPDDAVLAAAEAALRHAEALDGWISAGGFLPSSWSQAQVRVLP